MNLSNRFSYKSGVPEFLNTPNDQILGSLTDQHRHRQLEQQQINAWRYQIKELKQVLIDFSEATLLLEFEIPRIGKRVDAIVILNGAILVLEYKVGAKSYDAQSIDQVYDYALDLKNFHKASHDLTIVPILIATEAPSIASTISFSKDGVTAPILTNSENLLNALNLIIKIP